MYDCKVIVKDIFANELGKVFSKFETRWQYKLQVDNSIDFWEFANAPSEFDTCLQGNLQVEILIKFLETRQQRYDSLVFATGPGWLG